MGDAPTWHLTATKHPVDQRTVDEFRVVQNEERQSRKIGHTFYACDIEIQAGNVRILLSPEQSRALIDTLRLARTPESTDRYQEMRKDARRKAAKTVRSNLCDRGHALGSSSEVLPDV